LRAAQLVAQGPPAGFGGRGGSGGGGRGGGSPAGGGGGRGGFPQKTRDLASADVLPAAKGFTKPTALPAMRQICAAFPPQGHSLLHSIIALNDQHGELVNAELLKHASPIRSLAAIL